MSITKRQLSATWLQSASTASGVRALVTVFAVLALTVVGLFVPGQATRAAGLNTSIVVQPQVLVYANVNGEVDATKELYRYDYAKLTFTWDATAADPRPEDQFSITLPAHFKFREEQSLPLKYKPDGQSAEVEVGACVYVNAANDNANMTCTFNDSVRGQTNVKGSGSVMLQAIQTTGEVNTSTFTINGVTPATIANPANQPIRERKDMWVPWTPSKWASGLGEV